MGAQLVNLLDWPRSLRNASPQDGCGRAEISCGLIGSVLLSAWRPLDPALDLGAVLAFRHVRTVARDNTVKYHWRTLQLLPSAWRPSYAGAPVEVLERPGGELAVCHQGETIPSRLAAGAGTMSAKPRLRPAPSPPSARTRTVLAQFVRVAARTCAGASNFTSSRPRPRRATPTRCARVGPAAGCRQRASATTARRTQARALRA